MRSGETRAMMAWRGDATSTIGSAVPQRRAVGADCSHRDRLRPANRNQQVPCNAALAQRKTALREPRTENPMRRILALIAFAACTSRPVFAQETFKLTCYSQAFTYDCDISPNGRFAVYDVDNLLSLFPHKEQEEVIRVDLTTGARQTVATMVDGPMVGFPSITSGGAVLYSYYGVQVFLSSERIDVSSAGTPGNGASYTPGSVSSDARFVVYSSRATNLTLGDSNGFADVYLRDRQTGTTERVSLGSGGVEGNGRSEAGAVSDDGRYIAFASDASNLVSGDTEGFTDVFLRDRQAGTTNRVSVALDGHGGNGASCRWTSPVQYSYRYPPVISADGNFVAFDSEASNLVVGDTNNAVDVFVRDVAAGVTRRVSLDANNQQLTAAAGPSISADGRFVSFSGGWIRDRLWNVSEYVAVNNTGGALGAYIAHVDDLGRFVVFSSSSQAGFSNCHPNGNADGDIYLRDRGTLTRGFCAGDGVAVACPCGNSSALGNGAGCANSTGAGAHLTSTGDARLSHDTFVLNCSGLPNSTCIFAQGNAAAAGGIGIAFGDGLRCVAGQVYRLAVKPSSNGGSSFPAAGDPHVSIGGNVQIPGTRYYQLRYRNAASFCTSETFNLSNGLEVLWGP
jgi:hypothetical protein